MRNQLHIVCLDVPFPADYGGAIDMFYRIQALHEMGLELTLHVFHYGREKQSELEKYGKVIYYERKRSFWHLFSKRPFIVQSRISAELLSNLRKDDAPILFEGIHTIWPLEMTYIQQRLTLVRMHNLEDEYYQGLRKQANWFQKIYFEQERVMPNNLKWLHTYWQSNRVMLKRSNPLTLQFMCYRPPFLP